MNFPLTCITKVDDNLIAVRGKDKSIYILDFSNDLIKEEELDKVLISKMEEHKDDFFGNCKQIKDSDR